MKKGKTIFLVLLTIVFLGTLPGSNFAQSGPLPLAELQRTALYKSLDEALQNPSQVYRLNLTNQNLTALPAEIGTLNNLQYCNLSKNQLTSLPPEIKHLRNLQWLILEDNNIASLPGEITELTNLEVLNLDGNSALDVDGAFQVAGAIPSLKELSMNKVLINTLPKSFFSLNNVEKLYLSNTGLNYFPEEMGQLYKLKVLDLTFNNIVTVPSDIEDMKRLLEIYLGGNQITKFPIEIQELRYTLQKISLASTSEVSGSLVGNPISEEEVIKLQQWLPKTVIENIYK
ncbi:MAG: leucine-rich repeat domain-containing protein [Ignavibacteriae bacterium]|nr:leucine-rich repeat domain-containing protein [Ignavibacteriota bacterium]MCB9244757.1 leucine-rich repeat domain-containing protein [Ignavibacteriales bacterium]